MAGTMAVAALIVLYLSHFLKSRHEEVYVPTVYFWQQAIKNVNKNRIWGRLSAFRTLMFLGLICILLALASLDPVLAPVRKIVVIMDTLSTTNTESAVEAAYNLVKNSDKCSLIFTGKTNCTKTDFEDPKGASLAEIRNFCTIDSGISAVSSAVREALAVSDARDIYLITGQKHVNSEHVNIIHATSGNAAIVSPVKVYVGGIYAEFVKVYCDSDLGYDFTDNPAEAELVLEDSALSVLPDWRTPGFVSELSTVLRQYSDRYGKTYAVGDTSYDSVASVDYITEHYSLFNMICSVIVLLMILDTLLWQRGKIV